MNEHPITPPRELVREWATTNGTAYKDLFALCQSVADQAAQWGADQQVEAYAECGNALSAARRPKPPSLKEQALAELDLLKGDANAHGLGFDAPAIRRAIESLLS